MVRKVIVGAAVVSTLALGAVGAIGGVAQAAPNPNGTGQPSQSCGSSTATNVPPGFNTEGFATAAAVYAGSAGTPSAANGAPQAVSQYDVACYQLTQSGQ